MRNFVKKVLTFIRSYNIIILASRVVKLAKRCRGVAQLG